MVFIDKNPKNNYQRKKVLSIFKDFEEFQSLKLQQFVLEDFDDFEFCSAVIISYLKTQKSGKLLFITVAIAKELYEYQYAFIRDKSLLIWKNSYDFEVKSKILSVFGSQSFKKELNIELFLKGFNISNKKKTEVKKILVEDILNQIKQKWIQPNFKGIEKNGSILETSKLEIEDLRKIKVIYFYEYVKF